MSTRMLLLLLWLTLPSAMAASQSGSSRPGSATVSGDPYSVGHGAYRDRVLREYDAEAAKKPMAPLPTAQRNPNRNGQHGNSTALSTYYPPSNSPNPKKQQREAAMRALLTQKNLSYRQRNWLETRFTRIDKKRNALLPNKSEGMPRSVQSKTNASLLWPAAGATAGKPAAGNSKSSVRAYDLSNESVPD